jgi:hypothetical protein
LLLNQKQRVESRKVKAERQTVVGERGKVKALSRKPQDETLDQPTIPDSLNDRCNDGDTMQFLTKK